LNLALCDSGCSGSPLLAADPYLSVQRWQAAGEAVEIVIGAAGAAEAAGAAPCDAMAVARRHPYVQRPGMRLDPDMGEAIRKLAAIDAEERSLPGRNCGACGAPTCVAFAEDVIMGRTAGRRCPHREETP
jgi:hypothetical protein